MQSTQSWYTTGHWPGGTVLALAASPHFRRDGVALAATRAGIFRTLDGAATWQPGGKLLAGSVITCLAAAAGSGAESTFFAGSNSGRLYSSTDLGESWAEVTSFAGLGIPTALAASPAFESDRTIFVATGRGIYRSQDGAQSWEHSVFGLLDPDILCLSCAPDFAQSQVVWCGAALGGLYRSRNAALAWRDAGLGLPDAAVQCILPYRDADGRDLVVAGIEEHGLFRSRDNGRSWQMASTDLGGLDVNCVVASPEGGILLAATGAGVMRSVDGGTTWSETAGGEFTGLDLAWAEGGTLLAGAFQDGIYRSDDYGRSWQPAAQGLIAHAVPLTARLSSGELAAVDMDGACALTGDAGGHWRSWHTDLDPQPVAVLAEAGWLATPTTVSHLETKRRAISLPEECDWPAFLAAIRSQGADSPLLLVDAQGMVYLTPQAGQPWQALVPPAPQQAVLAAGLSPHFAQDQTIFLVTGLPNRQGRLPLQVWISEDRGDGWLLLADLENEFAGVVAGAGADPEERPLFLAFQNRLVKFYRRASPGEDGYEWAVHQHFFPEEMLLSALVVSDDYAQSRKVTVGGNAGLWQSADGGLQWQPIGQGLPPHPVVGLHPDGAGVTAVLLGGALWRSDHEPE